MEYNEKSFSYLSHYGTHFMAARCDFKGNVEITSVVENPLLFAADIAEMIGYHTTNILPKLNGFQGYNCIKFVSSYK